MTTPLFLPIRSSPPRFVLNIPFRCGVNLGVMRLELQHYENIKLRPSGIDHMAMAAVLFTNLNIIIEVQNLTPVYS